MRLNRREFIVAGVVGTALGCRSGGTARQAGAQPIKLTVHFAGLCGVVHREALRVSDVLLVDAARTATLATKPHSPRLLTDPANIKSGPAHQIEPDGKKRAYWDLQGYKVTLASGATSGTSRATGLRRPGEAKLPMSDKVSFPDVTWLAHMSRIPNTGQGKLHGSNLADDGKPDKVATRIRFTGGQFSARFDVPYQEIPWRIGTGAPPPFEQAIGQVMVSQSIDAESLTFALEPYAPGTVDRIVLGPPAGTDGTLLVEIENMPTDHHKCKNPEASELKHFAAFYELLESPPDPSNRPVPECTQNCRDCGSMEEEPVYCPPTEYNP